MPIIDCQIHEVGPYWDWLGESTELQHKLLGELMIAYLDAVGVDRVVDFCAIDPTTAAALAAALPERIAFVPQFDPEQPDIEAAVKAAKARHRAGQLGVRAQISWPMDGSEVRRLDAGGWDPVFAACQRHQVPIFLLITGSLPKVVEIARRFPDLTVIIDHLGLRQPPMDQPDDPPFTELPQLLDFAGLDNVFVKLCGLPALSREPFPFSDVEPHLRAIVDTFGAERLMWGSDTTRFTGRIGIHRFQPLVTLGDYTGKHTYAESLLFIRESPVLSVAEKHAILGGTLQHVLDWA